jgi:endonuclease-3
VASATDAAVADAIRSGGMADQKAPRIRRILATVEAREGAADLSRLQTLDDGAVSEYLTSLPGVGPKTAACVLLFSMGRPAFPVDTHVHRVAGRLGWIPPRVGAARAQELLEEQVPEEIRYPLHLALVAHGRRVCRARAPRCETCVLRAECPRRGL